MSTTTNDLNQMIAEFQNEWEGTTIDLMEVVMTMDAAQRAYKAFFGKQPSSGHVIALSRVIAKQQLRKAMKAN